MSSRTCPHGLPRGTCEICRVMEPAPAVHARPRRPDARRRGAPASLLTLALVAVAGFFVVGWVMGAFFAVVRILELAAVAAVAGWVGWTLGVARGRRS